MITPTELSQYIDTLRAAGVTGRVKIGDIEVTIASAVEKSDAPVDKRTGKQKYDDLLFAATEGIPEEEERS